MTIRSKVKKKFTGDGWRISADCPYCFCLFLIIGNILFNILVTSSSAAYRISLLIAINFLLVSISKFNFLQPVIQSFIIGLIVTIGAKFYINESSWFICPVLWAFNYISYYRFGSWGRQFRNSFTPCEMLIVTQGALICLTQSTLCELGSFVPALSLSCSNDLTTRVLQLLFFGLTITVILMSYSARNDNLAMVYTSLVTGLLVMYSRLAVIINKEPLTWLFLDVFFTHSRIHLFELWACLFIFTIFFCVIVEAFADNAANTVIRKFFHLIVIPVYASGLKYDPPMLYFLSCCLLWILIVLETLRITDPENGGKAIVFFMERFKNDNDRGFITLTHIYLLIGLSLSLWISPNIDKISFNFASGMITVAVGDTAAAIIGSRFGKHKWLNSNKSIEGTLGSILCQIIASILIKFYLKVSTNILVITILSIISSIIEAKTIQIDNLILPLYFNLLWLIAAVFKLI
ncbi:dolichol kinase-like [Panonychus citri]|uniref:dolichol kinase-like n=1 Tax=Panonychus citri TaxID=50023 RepID=UPI002307D57B|nr:dolichol kinase-like [Panonychus citri]